MGRPVMPRNGNGATGGLRRHCGGGCAWRSTSSFSYTRNVYVTSQDLRISHSAPPKSSIDELRPTSVSTSTEEAAHRDPVVEPRQCKLDAAEKSQCKSQTTERRQPKHEATEERQSKLETADKSLIELDGFGHSLTPRRRISETSTETPTSSSCRQMDLMCSETSEPVEPSLCRTGTAVPAPSSETSAQIPLKSAANIAPHVFNGSRCASTSVTYHVSNTYYGTVNNVGYVEKAMFEERNRPTLQRSGNSPGVTPKAVPTSVESPPHSFVMFAAAMARAKYNSGLDNLPNDVTSEIVLATWNSLHHEDRDRIGAEAERSEELHLAMLGSADMPVRGNLKKEKYWRFVGQITDFWSEKWAQAPVAVEHSGRLGKDLLLLHSDFAQACVPARPGDATSRPSSGPSVNEKKAEFRYKEGKSANYWSCPSAPKSLARV